MLKYRLITAAVFLPLLIGALYFGNPMLISGILIISVGFCTLETVQMMIPALSKKFLDSGKSNEQDLLSFGVRLIPVIVCLGVISFGMWGNEEALLGVVMLASAILMIFAIFSQPTVDHSVAILLGYILALVYGCLPWISIWKLYHMGDNGRYVLLLFSVVMLSDSGAYFVGRAIGQRKLAPRLSPKKTWEGAFGGLFCAAIGACTMNAIFSNSLGPWWLMFLVAFLGGIAGIVGDLIESALKRFSGIKDSGTIFPGHGGFLDRVDAIVIAAPIILAIIGGYRLFL